MTTETAADREFLKVMGETAYAARMKCKRDPLYLGHNVLGFDFADPADFHLKTAAAMARKETFILMAPRGHGKTTLCNEIGIVFEIIRNPDIRILLAHSKLEIAQKILKGATDQFRINPTLRALFPEMVPQSKSEDPTKTQYICPARRKANKEPTVMCASPDAGVTGLHFDMIMATDLVTEQNVPGPIGKGSYEAMDQIWEFMKNFGPLADVTNPEFREQHNCTRWFDGDPYGRIEEEYKHFRVIKAGIELDAKGDPIPIWSLVTKEILRDKKERAGKWLWAANYCQGPLSSETQIFKESYFKVYEQTPPNLSVAITVDMAHEGDGPEADEVAIVASGTDEAGNLYVVSAQKGKWTLAQSLSKIVACAEGTGAKWVGIEAKAYKKTIKAMLEMEMVRSGLHVPVRLLQDHSRDKVTRAGPLAFFAEMYGIWVKPEMLRTFVKTFLAFPASRDDHFVDALAYRAQDVRPAHAVRQEVLKRRNVIDLDAWRTKGSNLISKMERGEFRGLRLA